MSRNILLDWISTKPNFKHEQTIDKKSHGIIKGISKHS